jgi:hypothetical protein
MVPSSPSEVVQARGEQAACSLGTVGGRTRTTALLVAGTGCRRRSWRTWSATSTSGSACSRWARGLELPRSGCVPGPASSSPSRPSRTLPPGSTRPAHRRTWLPSSATPPPWPSTTVRSARLGAPQCCTTWRRRPRTGCWPRCSECYVPPGPLLAPTAFPATGFTSSTTTVRTNPVEPGTLITRLQTIGFHRITVNVDDRLKFIAHKPADDPGA